jgi:hypothetical protein
MNKNIEAAVPPSPDLNCNMLLLIAGRSCSTGIRHEMLSLSRIPHFCPAIVQGGKYPGRPDRLSLDVPAQISTGCKTPICWTEDQEK